MLDKHVLLKNRTFCYITAVSLITEVSLITGSSLKVTELIPHIDHM